MFRELQISRDELLEITLERLRGLMDQPYWHRVWILQEFILAKQFFLQCGHRSIEVGVSDAEAVVFIDFCATGPFFFTVLPGLETFQKIEFGWLLRMLTLRLSYIHHKAPGNEDFDFEIFDKSRFYQLLLITRHYQATDPRDKLFGLLGVSEIGLLPDYEASTKAVYVDFAKRCIREGRFDFLCSAGIYPASYSTDFNEDLPS
jgi:hypothetical protein